MTPGQIVVALAIGLVTGFINTLAGSGSLVTLPFLIFLGLPADVANGTNRVSILFSTIVGTITLKRSTNMSLKGNWLFIVPTVITAIAGAFLASQLKPQHMEIVIAVVMTVMLIPLLIRPKRWLREASGAYNPRLRPLLVLIFLLIGFYGGFIQAGTGILFLSAFVLLANYSLPEANVLKNLIVAIYTVPVLIIFILNDQVVWSVGLIMAVGQSAGAWVAGRFAGRSKKAATFIHYLLILMVVASLIKLFGGFEWLAEWWTR